MKSKGQRIEPSGTSQENIREEYEKSETAPSLVETKSQVPQQEKLEENCECLESNESQDSFVSAEDKELTDDNLPSKRVLEQKINLLEDCLKALMKPWNLREADSTEDQQSTLDYVMETTNYRQADETGNENDNFGVEETTESTASELGEVLSTVLRNTWLTDSMHDDVQDAVMYATPTTKVLHVTNGQTSTSASEEQMENEMTQIQPGFSAILDSILTQRVNDYTLNLEKYETPFAVEYISKEEARKRRWLPPKKLKQESTWSTPHLYEYERDKKEDSHCNGPTTNVYYCIESQLMGEEEPCFKTFTEKSSPRRKLVEFNRVAKLLGEDKMEQCISEQAKKMLNEGIDGNVIGCCGPLNGDIDGSEKLNDRVLSDYQEQLICGHLNYLNKLKDCITLSGEEADEMRSRNQRWSKEQKSVCLPDKNSKCGLHKNLRYVSCEFQNENQNCENDINCFGIDDEDCTLRKGDINHPPSIALENKETTTVPPFVDGRGAHFCSYILPETSCSESGSLQLHPCRDCSSTFSNFALKSDVTEVLNGEEDTNTSSIPAACSNLNQAHEETDTDVVCTHDQERFVALQSFRINDIPSISRRRRRANESQKDGTSDEYSTS